MLKEKIEVLNTANDDVLKISAMKTSLKTEYHKLKRSANLKTEYQKKLVAVDTELDGATTYLTNQYEEFNDYKATHDTSKEKEVALTPIRNEIQLVKNQIKNSTDKVEKTKLKIQLQNLKTKLKETKVLYSKSIKNKLYLYGGLAVILVIIVTSLLIAYLVINKPNLSSTEGIFTLITSIVCLGLILVYIGFLVFREHKKWVLDREKGVFWTFFHSIWAFILNSFGVGVFATYTTVFKKTGLFNDDKKMVGTLNTGSMVGGLLGGILTLQVITVQIWTLIILVGVCLIGSYIGAKLVQKINRKSLTLTMGILLVIATILMFLSMSEFGIIPKGTADGLVYAGSWWKLVIAIFFFAGFGMLISFGVGIYAPTMVVVSLLGMNFLIAAPIMMLCAGFAGQVNCYTSMKKNMYLPKSVWSMLLGSIVGDFIYFLVIYLGVYYLGGVDKTNIAHAFQWISIPVIGYSAFLLLKTYWKLRKIPIPPKQKPITLDEFKTKSYLVKPKINYEKENQKLKYQKIHW